MIRSSQSHDASWKYDSFYLQTSLHGPCSPFLSDIAPIFLPSSGSSGISLPPLPSLLLVLFCLPCEYFSPLVHQLFYVLLLLSSWLSLFAHTIFHDSLLDFLPLSVILDSSCTPAISILPTSDPISLFGGLEQHFTVIWDTGASRPVLPIPPIVSVPFFNPPFPYILVLLLLVTLLLESGLYSGLSFLTLFAS